MTALEHITPGALVGAGQNAMPFDELLRRADVLAKSGLVPKQLNGNPAGIVLVGSRGLELGFTLGYALENIDVIESRAVPNAQARLALLRRHGHEARFVESTAERAVIKGRRREYRTDPDAWVTAIYTIEDARRAELTAVWVERWVNNRPERYIVGDDRGVDEALVKKAPQWAAVLIEAGSFKTKDNWRRDPVSMLRARAATHLCRMEFSDVMAGFGIADIDLDSDAGELVADGDEIVGDGSDGDSAAAVPDAGGGPVEANRPAPHVDPDDEITDAEIVDDQPPAAGDGPRFSGPQLVAIQFRNHGITDRDERLRITASMVGRDVTSEKDLTPHEISAVLEALADPAWVPPAGEGGDDGTSTGDSSSPEGGEPDDEPGEDPPASPVPADPDVIARLVARMDALPVELRKACKTAYMHGFGFPHDLPADLVSHASSLIGEFEALVTDGDDLVERARRMAERQASGQ